MSAILYLTQLHAFNNLNKKKTIRHSVLSDTEEGRGRVRALRVRRFLMHFGKKGKR